VKRKLKNSGTSEIQHPCAYYPAFLDLKDKKSVVVGGGRVAERKIYALLKAGANVTVISPEITRKIKLEAQKGRVRHICRNYKRGDIDKAFIVIAATDSPDINKKVSGDASCLVNVVDTPHLCNFIVPSVVIRGPLTIAVSSSGVSPGLSRSIRMELEEKYGPEFSQYLELLRDIRKQAMKCIRDRKKRGSCLKAVASKKMLIMLREKGYKETKTKAETLLKKASEKS
jgi:precorrin-2 dehydrogenase / sirohydrochlorin ferrochelatase